MLSRASGEYTSPMLADLISGVTFPISSLAPGGTDEESLPYAVTTDEIMVRSSSASVPFYAMES
jgi:hypothetical protein